MHYTTYFDEVSCFVKMVSQKTLSCRSFFNTKYKLSQFLFLTSSFVS